MRALSMAVNHADLEALAYQQELHAHHQYQQCYNKQTQDKSFRNRPVQGGITNSITLSGPD